MIGTLESCQEVEQGAGFGACCIDDLWNLCSNFTTSTFLGFLVPGEYA